jgi:hypothetical protein
LFSFPAALNVKEEVYIIIILKFLTMMRFIIIKC